MTQKRVTDEQFGGLCFRLDDFKRRVVEGTLPFTKAMADLQLLIEGETFQQHVFQLSLIDWEVLGTDLRCKEAVGRGQRYKFDKAGRILPRKQDSQR